MDKQEKTLKNRIDSVTSQLNDVLANTHFERVKEKLPKNDLDLVILKGHLLIEERLDSILMFEFDPDSFDLKKINLRFFQKLLLSKAVCHKFGEKPMANSLWDGIQKLNSLRNELAHNLETVRFEKKLDAVLAIHRDIRAHYWEGMTEEFGVEYPTESGFPKVNQLRIFIQWCLSELDFYIAVTARNTLEYGFYWQKHGAEIIQKSAGGLVYSQMQASILHRQGKIENLLNYVRKNEEMKQFLTELIPGWEKLEEVLINPLEHLNDES